MNVRPALVSALFACAVLTLTGPITTAQQPKKTEESNESKTKFREFAPDGKFKILMPGRPKDSSTEKGGLDIKIWVVESGKTGVYLVSSTELPGGKNLNEDAITETLDKSATGQINGMQGKETKRREIKLAKKHQGLQVEAEIPKGPNNPNGGLAVSRLYLIDGQLYQILALGDKDFVTGKDVQKFLDSFQMADK